MKWLIKLYPRAWRLRFGAEAEELVATQPGSLRLAIDLLAGAVDARWTPQMSTPAETDVSAETKGLNIMKPLQNCRASAPMSQKDAVLSGGLIIGGSLLVAAMLMIWDNPVLKTIALVMTPGVWLLATQPFYLRGRSTAAKVILIGGPLVILALIAIVTVLIQQRVG